MICTCVYTYIISNHLILFHIIIVYHRMLCNIVLWNTMESFTSIFLGILWTLLRK